MARRDNTVSPVFWCATVDCRWRLSCMVRACRISHLVHALDLLLCFSAFLLLCFSASLLLCFSIFPTSQVLCFSLSRLSRFSTPKINFLNMPISWMHARGQPASARAWPAASGQLAGWRMADDFWGTQSRHDMDPGLAAKIALQ